MKKITLSIISMILALTISAQYKTTLGLTARVNVATFRTGNTLRTNEVVANPEVGLSLVIPASPCIALNLEGTYLQTGGRYGTFDDRPREYDLRLRYAKLALTHLIGKGNFKLALGYYEAYLLDKVTIGSTFYNNYSFYSSHWIANRSDRGVVVGFDIDLGLGGKSNGLIFTNRGSYGLRRVGNGNDYPLWNEYNTSISGGLKYNF